MIAFFSDEMQQKLGLESPDRETKNKDITVINRFSMASDKTGQRRD